MLPLRTLRRFTFPLLLASAAPLCTHAQIVTDLDLPEKLRIQSDPETENGVLLSWFGRNGFSYFLQTTTDLVAEPWQYLPVIETGYDDTIEYGLLLPSPRFFTRLVLHPETSFDPMSADFDGDGLGNDLEFQNQTDPLNPDTDGDHLPDGWEIDRGLPARDNANALGDTDGDGASDLLEYLRGTDPNTPELAAGVGILIAGLTHPQDSQIVHVGARGSAWIRDGSAYRLWSAGALSAPLLDVPSPAPEPDNDPSTDELYTYTEGHWTNRHGQAAHNARAYDNILHTAETLLDYEETNRQLDAITVVSSPGSAATPVSLPTFTWTSLWDGYLYLQNHSFRIARVHGLDDDGFVWAELALTASTYDGGAGTAYVLDHGIYKIDLNDPALPAQPTAYTPYGFLGVSRTGVALGQLASQSYGEYSVNGVAVDYRPLFAGDTGAVWGWKTESVEIAPGTYSSQTRYRAYFPDGPSILAPTEFNGNFAIAEATRFDPWNRLHGRQGAEQSVWDLAADPANPGGDPVWTRSAYQTLILGNGLYTNHRVPPGPWEPQGGIAWWWDAATETIMSAPSLFVPGRLSADADRDGEIHPPGPDDPDATYPGRPLRFTANDDDDNPGTTPEADYLNEVVDGEGDLPDFLPVFLDIGQLLEVLPPGASVKYKLSHADGALNFVYTSLTRATAFDYINASTATTDYGPGQNQAAHEASTHQISATGLDIFDLDPDLVTRIKDNDQGVILIEGRQLADKPLVLAVEKDNVAIAKLELPLLGARFEPRPGMVQKGWDAYLEKGTPWTSVVAGEQGQVASFHVATATAASRIGFEVAEEGRAYLLNVDSEGRLLTAPGGDIFTLSGTHTDVPIYAAVQTGLTRYETAIVAKYKTPDNQLTTEVAKLKVSILVPRELKIHLFKVVDSNSPTTEFTQMPTMTELRNTLNGIYAQAGIRFVAGDVATLDSLQLGINYDEDLDGSLGATEWNPLQLALKNYLTTASTYSGEPLATDIFAFVFNASRGPSVTLENGQLYHQRGGNLLRPDGFSYGPFVASEGNQDTDQIAAAIGHEIGHAVNLPFGNDPGGPWGPSDVSRFGVTGAQLDPSLDDDHNYTTSGHDNFRFKLADTPSDFGWSLVKSGLLKGDITTIDAHSRSLRKLFWEEANFRVNQRISGGK